MKVLFLDVDGVLNSTRSVIASAYKIKQYGIDNPDDPYFMKHTRCTIDPISVDLVNRVCKLGDIKIVISSTHRKHIPDGPNKLTEMKEYFKYLGLDSERIVGWTEVFWGNSTEHFGHQRGFEIQMWIDAHPEITHYVILDDDSDMLDSQKGWLVRTNNEIGVSWKNFADMKDIFDLKDPGIV